MALAMAPSAAEAALATSMLHRDSETEDFLDDSDWETLTGTDAIVDKLDVLYGFWEVQAVNGVTPADVGSDVFVMIFALKVLEKKQVNAGDTNDYRYGFGPMGDKDVFNDLFGTGNYATDNDTIAVVYSDSNGLPGTPWSSGVPSISDVETSKWLWEWGFSGGAPTYDTDVSFGSVGSEFWVAKSHSDTGSADDISFINGSGGAVTYWAAFNVLKENTALLGGVELLAFSKDIDGVAGLLPSTDAQVFVHGGNQSVTHSDWLLTDTDIYIKSTPEPSTWIALLGLALMGLIWRWRRSK